MKMGAVKLAVFVGMVSIAAFGGVFVVDGVPQKDAVVANSVTNKGVIVAAGPNITLNGRKR